MVFERILVGFDGSPASERALSVALALRAPEGRVESLTVAETYFATHAGMDAAAWDAQLREKAETARAQAARALGDVDFGDATVTTGHAAQTLLRTANTLDADLIAVGAHGHSRVAAILLGSVAARIVHDAPCSVLVARGEGPLEHFPSSIVVGVDGSACSTEAATLADALARSTGADLRQLEADSPVEALVEASRSADLVVVGSRGMRGIAALGSVAERVAHQADCPVLVVRGARARGRAEQSGPAPRASAGRS
jgi:nucleotide-binding universal stress UspA family protein